MKTGVWVILVLVLFAGCIPDPPADTVPVAVAFAGTTLELN